MNTKKNTSKLFVIIIAAVLMFSAMPNIRIRTEAALAGPADYAFDYIYYADKYDDVRRICGYNEAALRNHWLQYGIKEGRSGSPIFDGKFYLSQNRDISRAIGSTNYAGAYYHFITWGYKEKRASSPYYYGQFYYNSYRDLSWMNSEELIQHYLRYGVVEKRRAGFSVYNGATANSYNSANNGKIQLNGSQCIGNGIYYLTSAVNGTSVADVSDGSRQNGANVHLWEKSGVQNQGFNVEYIGNGYYKIVAAHSGKVLDIHDGNMNNFNNIKQWDWADVLSQMWVIVPRGNGYYSIHSAKNTNYVLDVNGANSKNGTNIQLYQYNGSKAQLFRFDSFVTASPCVSNGSYYITSSLNGSSVLDVQNAGVNNGANVHLWAKSGVNNQKFSVDHIGNGYYRIIAGHSNKVLDVSDGVMRNGQNIKQWSWANVDNQKWIFVNRGNGYYSIHSAKNRDYVIDVSGGNSNNGTNIWLYQYNGSKAQLFRLDTFTSNNNNNNSNTNNNTNNTGVRVSLNVPSFKQFDSKWKNTYIGNRTIGQIGCLLTSVSMKYSYHTNTTTYPNVMKSKLHFSNNDMYWSSLSNLGYQVTGNYGCSINQSIMSKIYTQLKAGKPVIIGGQKRNGGPHWIVITGYTGNSTSSFNSANFTINDPNSSSRTNLQQFLNIYPTVLRLIY